MGKHNNAFQPTVLALRSRPAAVMAFVAYQRWRFSIVDLATRPAKSTAEPQKGRRE
jgi:hypothetical protein